MKRYQDIADPGLAKALAHPLRTRILSSLENRTASPSELADELGAPLGVVSYHVRRLHALRFLRLVRRVARRGAVEHYYTTVAGPTITNTAWAATPRVVKQAMLAAALGEVGTSVSAAANLGGFDQPEAHVSRTPVTLDEQGWKALADELDGLLGRIAEIESQSHERLVRSDHDDEQQATVVLMLFNSPPAASANGSPGAAPKRAARAKSAG